MKTRWRNLILAALGVLCGFLLNTYYHTTRGLDVIIENDSGETLVAVKLHFSDRTYELGDIQSGIKKSATVPSNAGNFLNATWQNLKKSAGDTHGLPVRIHHNDRGLIKVNVKMGGIIDIHTDIISRAPSR